MEDANIQSVFILILDETEKQILLIQRRDVPVWVLPGGGRDPGETLEQTALREAEEETGFSVNVVRFAGTFDGSSVFVKPSAIFVAKTAVKKKHPCSHEVGGMQFFPIDAMPEYRMPPPFVEIIRHTLMHPSFFHLHIQSITWKRILSATFFHPVLMSRFLFAKVKKPIIMKKNAKSS